jgi:hypothetical protein
MLLMTKEKFKELCERVLVPRLSELLRRGFVEQEGMLGTVMRELMRVEDKIDALARTVGANEGER